MDTPERSQIGTPVSKIEESPFSNFANSLSPINQVKTIHISQTISSINFTSPPSVFTSPHVSLQKEARFLRRHQISDLGKPEFCTSELKGDGANEGTIPTKQPDQTTDEVLAEPGQCIEDASTEPLSENPELILQRDNKAPISFSASPSGAETENCEQNKLALVPFAQQTPGRRYFGIVSNEEARDENKEGSGSDWQSVISDAADLLTFDSPSNEAVLQGTLQKPMEGERNFLASLFINDAQDHANKQQLNYSANVNFSEPFSSTDQFTEPSDVSNLDQTSHREGDLANTSIKEGFTAADNPSDNLESEPLYNLHRGMRRRCLVFEIAEARKNLNGGPIPSSLNSSHRDGKLTATSISSLKVGGESSKRGFPGIGLHLNALATSAKDPKYLKQGVHTSGGQLTSIRQTFRSSIMEAPLATPVSAALDSETNHAESDRRLTLDASQLADYATTEEVDQNSPKRKRRKFENTGEGESCKRCNCKKSKCLKLYCECFAAGVYCVGPCSCQECFNKPTHADTVIATRKQIESRNPLAFAPKVIRGSDPISELGDDSSRTPASARHKRGCNCKKSNCLKKYCECYQGGVGCSVSCRCEGCKNGFGRKDGSNLLGTDCDLDEGTPASEKTLVARGSDQNGIRSDDDQNPECVIPETPLIPFRTSMPLPMSSKGKPPRSSHVMAASSSGLLPSDGLGRSSTFLRSQPKTKKHLQPVSGEDMPAVLQNTGASSPNSGIKTLSPNSKRVSPPHHNVGQSPNVRSSRKLILQSIPSFPSLTPRR